MDQHRIELAERQLDRVLQFANRIESKISIIFATDLGIVAIMLSNLSYDDVKTWYIAIPLVIGVISVSQSIYHLYKAAYPELSGGEDSLIYFAEIARRTEQNFLKEYKSLTLEEMYDDIAGQIWRNSQIMSQKFVSVRSAFAWTIFSTIPWIFFLLAVSLSHERAILVN